MTDIAKNDRRVVFRWAMYDWANSAYATTSGAIVAAFFTGEIVPEDGFAGLSGETLWAAVVSIGAFVLFLGMPILGAVADYNAAKRAFLRAFAFIGAAFTMLVPFVPNGQVPLFLFMFLVSNIGFVAANVFYDGFLKDISDDASIDTVSSKGFALGYVGGGLYVLLAFVVITLSGDEGITGLTTTGAARLGIFGAGVWWVLFTVYSLRGLPETGSAGELPEELQGMSPFLAYTKVGFERTLGTARKLMGFKQLMLFVLAFIFYNDGTQTVINISGAYAEGTLNLELEQIIVAFLIVQFVAFFGALAFGSIAGRIGTREAIVVTLVIWILIAIGGFLLPEEQTTPLYLLAVAIGFVLGGVQALSRSLYGTMIPEEAAAEFYGFFSVFSKFSAIWGPLVFAIVSGVTGSGRPAILSVIVFMAIGMVLLMRVDVDEARASKDRWSFEGAHVDAVGVE